MDRNFDAIVGLLLLISVFLLNTIVLFAGGHLITGIINLLCLLYGISLCAANIKARQELKAKVWNDGGYNALPCPICRRPMHECDCY